MIHLNHKPYAIKPNQEGVVVIFAVILISIILSIVFALSAIFIPKIKTSSDIKNSVTAAYAAESAIEWCLYVNRIGLTAQPVMSNGATYINGITGVGFVPADCSVQPIRALGTFFGVSRAFEISF